MEKKTKVLLVQPNYDIDNIGSSPPWMPLALVELATYVNVNGHEARIYDRNLYPNDEDFIKTLEEFKPDIVGLTCYTSKVIKDVLNVAFLTREYSDSIYVIVGGIHATLEPQSLLDIPDIDYVIRGEGERPLLEICNLIQNEGVDEISQVPNVNHNEEYPLMDLNEMPIPDYGLIEVPKYCMTTFSTSRGCMGACKFCYNRGRRLRFYDTDKMIKMMTGVIEKYKIKEFTIADDNFATLGERTEKICEALSKYKCIFHCFMRADQATEEVIKNLKKAGCWDIQFGFESGSQRILDFINKRTTVEQKINALKLCKKYGIFVDGSFVIGFPGETEADLVYTTHFIKKYKPDAVNINLFKPFPHTEFYDLCMAQGKVKQPETLEDWISFCDINAGEPNFSDIPTKTLVELSNNLNKRSLWLKMKKFALLCLRGHTNYAMSRLSGGKR